MEYKKGIVSSLRSERILLVILIAAAILAAAATILFLTRQPARTYQEENTPQSVVADYLTALRRGDFDRAASLVWVLDAPLDPERMRSALVDSALSEIARMRVQVGTERIRGEQATVSVGLDHASNDPLRERNLFEMPATLARHAGRWYITEMPYPFWTFQWVEDPSEAQKDPP